MQSSLFLTTGWEEIPAIDAEIRLLHDFLSPAIASDLFQSLQKSTKWRQDKIRVFGREHPLPRLQQWFGDTGQIYKWSGIEMVPEPWNPTLLEIKSQVETASGAQFNSLLINLYRDGRDTVAWHADDEAALGPNPTIASISLGASRDFLLRHVDRKLQKLSLTLMDGSLLLMAGSTQRFWEHSIPRRLGVVGARINLTFRNIVIPMS